jgi:hypothetical protein
MSYLNEPSRNIPIIHEADVCVLGGSCTGLFAAVRAARLGARVVIVEKDNCFGGIATTAMVNVWHSLWDTEGKKQIIAGLTEEVIDRLEQRGALIKKERTNPSVGCSFNSEELKIELDELAHEARIKIYLHTQFCSPAPIEEGQPLTAVFVENKNGRGAIKAKAFIDATGDGDLAQRLGCKTYFAKHLQPATACARFSGWESLGLNTQQLGELILSQGPAHNLPPTFAWGGFVPASATYMLAATRIHNINPVEADDLTHGEIEGRRQVRAIMDILRQAVPDASIGLEALPSRLGLRESRHIESSYQLTGDDVLYGKSFDDTIAQGSYRVDIHHQNKPGITLRYLNGVEEYSQPGHPKCVSRWRPESTVDPTFYQIPYRSLLPQNGPPNLIVAGRMLDIDPIAYAAVRVMVNMNQTGEAAGVAAALAADRQIPVAEVSPTEIRNELIAGGSAL